MSKQNFKFYLKVSIEYNRIQYKKDADDSSLYFAIVVTQKQNHHQPKNLLEVVTFF